MAYFKKRTTRRKTYSRRSFRARRRSPRQELYTKKTPIVGTITGTTTGATLGHTMNDIAIGAGTDQRLGKEINIQSYSHKIHLACAGAYSSSVAPVHVRIVTLVDFNPQYDGGALKAGYADYFGTTSAYKFKNEQLKITLLSDKTYILDNNRRAVTAKVYRRKAFRTKYRDVQFEQGLVRTFICADGGGPVIGFGGEAVIKYYP